MNRHTNLPEIPLLLSASEMQQADRAAIKRRGGDAYPLMHQAGKNAFARILQAVPAGPQPLCLLVLCGAGNNGGDGMVVAAEALKAGMQVSVVLLGDAEYFSDATARAYRELPPSCVMPLHAVPWEALDVIVDGLFGIGLSREVEGDYATAIRQANASRARRIAIDIPSGVEADSGRVLGIAFEADETVSFFASKAGHWLMPGKACCGELQLTQIGILPEDAPQLESPIKLNHPRHWQSLLPAPSLGQHKYHRGHCLIVGGGIATSGASKLAAKAALRAGAGLVSILCSQSSLLVYASWATSVMTKPYKDEEEFAQWLNHEKTSSIAFGMGAGTSTRTRERALCILQSGKPCVLDAEALSSWEGQDSTAFFAVLHRNCVLTPHAGEFARLFPEIAESGEGRLQQAQAAAKQSGAIVVLKGNDTLIAAPDGRCFINAIAPPNLATAGSGDVLSGIITAMLAQGIPAFEAAAIAVWKHSMAARHYSKGMIADDIVEGLLEMDKP